MKNTLNIIIHNVKKHTNNTIVRHEHLDSGDNLREDEVYWAIII